MTVDYKENKWKEKKNNPTEQKDQARTVDAQGHAPSGATM
jgi:hypothetical protein